MSLLDPTAGQLLDRYAALAVKVGHFRRAGRPADHLAGEMAAIAARLAGADRRAAAHLRALYRLHRRMWGLVDVVAGSPDLIRVGRAARVLQRLNHERHRRVGLIDRACGCYAGAEKLGRV